MRQLCHQRPGGHVPHVDAVVAGARGQHAPGRAERDRVDPVGGAAQSSPATPGWPGCRDVPQPDLVVLAAGRQHLPGRAERDRRHDVRGPGQRPAHGTGLAGSATTTAGPSCPRCPPPAVCPAGLNATDSTYPVGPCSGQQQRRASGLATFHSRTVSSALPAASSLTGRAERHRVHRVGRAGQRLAERDRPGRVGDVPQRHLPVGPGRGQHGAVRADRRGVQRADAAMDQRAAERNGVPGRATFHSRSVPSAAATASRPWPGFRLTDWTTWRSR